MPVFMASCSRLAVKGDVPFSSSSFPPLIFCQLFPTVRLCSSHTVASLLSIAACFLRFGTLNPLEKSLLPYSLRHRVLQSGDCEHPIPFPSFLLTLTHLSMKADEAPSLPCYLSLFAYGPAQRSPKTVSCRPFLIFGAEVDRGSISALPIFQVISPLAI